jgi:preprotein translocase subunit YajC
VGAGNYGPPQPAAIRARFPEADRMNPFTSPAYAQAADGGIVSAIGSSPLGQFLPLILIFVLFYFLMIRPQQEQAKKLKAQIAAVKKGDKVLTAGGIVAQVTRAREGAAEIEVEIAPNVKVTVLRETLTSVLNPTPAAAANDAK